MTIQPTRRAVLVMRSEHPSVLAIKVDQLCVDHDNPWKTEPSTLQGFAICVGPGLLLAAAHLVEDAREDPQPEEGDPDGVIGTVTAINYDIDLALIELQPADATGLVPLELGAMVEPGDDVVFHGAKQVAGIVTKIDVQRCSASARHLLLASVRFFGLDKASGGVLADRKLVGMCVQRLKDDDDLFEMVPVPLIRHFLAGCRELPSLCITTQNTNNAHLRKAMRLLDDEGGALVIDVDHGSPAATVLQRDDVILVLDGREVSRDITSLFGESRVRLDVALGTHSIGDVIELVIKRRGDRMTVLLPLGRCSHSCLATATALRRATSCSAVWCSSSSRAIT